MRRISSGSASDWLWCAAAADFWMARAVAASAPRSIIQAPRARGSVRATTGMPASPGGSARGHGDGCVVGVARLRGDDQQQVRECRRIACRTRWVRSAAGWL